MVTNTDCPTTSKPTLLPNLLSNRLPPRANRRRRSAVHVIGYDASTSCAQDGMPIQQMPPMVVNARISPPRRRRKAVCLANSLSAQSMQSGVQSSEQAAVAIVARSKSVTTRRKSVVEPRTNDLDVQADPVARSKPVITRRARSKSVVEPTSNDPQKAAVALAARSRRKSVIEPRSDSAKEHRRRISGKRDPACRGVVMNKKAFVLLREIFRQYDLSRTGSITKEAFIQEVGRITPQIKDHAEDMFNRSDKNKDGSLDFCEFVQMYNPHVTKDMVSKLCNRYGGALYIEDLEAKRVAEEEAKQMQLKEAKLRHDSKELTNTFRQWCPEGESSISIKTLRSRCPRIEKWLSRYTKSHTLTCEDFIDLCGNHYRPNEDKSFVENARALAGHLDKWPNADKLRLLGTMPASPSA